MGRLYAVVSRPGPVEAGILSELAAGAPAFTEARRIAAGVSLRTLEGGSGPPLVLLHGRGHAATSWLPLLPALARGRRVIAVDLPGFGHSAWTPFPDRAGFEEALRFFVEPVEALLCDLDLVEAPLVGHSLGGLVALEIALRRRARPRRLGLIAAMGLGPEMSALGRAYFALGPENLAGRAGAAIFAKLAHDPGTPLTPRLDALHAELASVPGGRPAAAAAFRVLAPALGPVPHRRDRLGEIDAGALILWGERDELLPAPIAIAAAAAMPRAELHVLRRGHAPHHEAPEEALGILEAFLRR